MLRKVNLTLVAFSSLTLVFIQSCATMAPKIQTFSFAQYVLEPGPAQVQKASDIEISLEAISLSDLYSYPRFFSFDLEDFPSPYTRDPIISGRYPIGPQGKRWEYPFITMDGKKQLFFSICKIKNNTDHILRMKDARIYFIIEGIDPIPAVPSFEELLNQADYFEALVNQEITQKTTLYIIQVPPTPRGFFRTIVRYNREAYKLINDLSKELLPGFSYEGILAFPAIPSIKAAARISFFDVTAKTDKAGNPIEKIQFDFHLQPKYVQMWYDRNAKEWRVGNPPEIK